MTQSSQDADGISRHLNREEFQKSLAQRVLLCFLGTQRRLGRPITLKEYGGLVAEVEGRPDPYSASSAQRWMAPGGSIPELLTLIAIAELAGEDPCRVILGPLDEGAHAL